jgi:Ran GTPase-activating protein (RanGAP) involved in mRNA processing and transport
LRKCHSCLSFDGRGRARYVSSLTGGYTHRIVEEEPFKIDDEGCRMLALFLMTNQTVTSLYLFNPVISSLGFRVLADALHFNTTVVHVNIRSVCHISGRGCLALAEMLKTNKTITEFYLQNCGLDDEDARVLAETLESNETVMYLFIGDNFITDEGCTRFAEMLKVNQSLTVLGLSRNDIEEKGFRELTDALKINQTLQRLDLWGYNIDQKEISASLERNKRLQEVKSNRVKLLTAFCGDSLKEHVQDSPGYNAFDQSPLRDLNVLTKIVGLLIPTSSQNA